MKSIGTSDSYQNDNLKIMIYFAKFLSSDISFYEIHKRDQIIAFLGTRIKDSENDPDKRWIRTWNDYLQRIKYFFRWLHNQKVRDDKGLEPIPISDWTTPNSENFFHGPNQGEKNQTDQPIFRKRAIFTKRRM
jgi:hypothetical protein